MGRHLALIVGVSVVAIAAWSGAPDRSDHVFTANSRHDSTDEAEQGTSDGIPAAELAKTIEPSRTGWPCLFGPHGDCRSTDPIAIAMWHDAGPPEVWRRAIGRGYSSPVVQDNRIVLLHRIGNEEIVTVVDIRSGETLWERRDTTAFRCKYEYSDGPYSTPRIDGERVYSVGAEARLSCRALADGNLIWQRDLKFEFDLPTGAYGFGAQLFVNERHVVLNVGGTSAGIVAFDKMTGAICWTATDHPTAFTMPRAMRIGNCDFLTVLTDVGLVSLDAATGEIRDTFPFRSKVSDSVTAVSPAVDGNRVVLAAGRGAGTTCLEMGFDGRLTPIWRERRALDSLFNTLVLADGFVLGFTSTRQGAAELRCVEVGTGRVAWSFPSDLERGQALAIGDTLVVLGEYGHLAALALDASEPRVRSFSTVPLLAAPCYSAPAYDRGLLVARNESTLVCWRLRPSVLKVESPR